MIQSVSVPSQQQVAAPERHQDVSGTIHRFDLGKYVPGLLEVVKGLVGAIEVQQRVPEIDQGHAFAEPAARRPAQLKAPSQQIDCLL